MKTKICEYVSYGHPDKVADQISDAIVDALILQDENTRAGVECLIKDNTIVLGGEVKSNATVDYEAIAKDVVDSIGYPPNHRLDKDNLKFINLIGQQSNEISKGVDKINEIGAGDQGFMYGFATNETSTQMPLGHYIAKTLCYLISNLENCGPDVKTQVSIVYDDNNKPVYIDDILVSSMMRKKEDISKFRENLFNTIKKTLKESEFSQYYVNETNIDINPCGEWYIGGPISDCGVTGRKIVVDSYGSYCQVGGGAFSGKDITKVDRSGAWMCRYIAKNIVAAGLADSAKVVLGYKISVAKPCVFEIELTNPINENIKHKLINFFTENIDMSPNGIIKRFFNETKGHYRELAEWGPFGNNSWPWEKTDLIDKLCSIVL